MKHTQTAINDILPDLITFSRPFKRYGFLPIGGRTTAIKLTGDNGVWVLASTELDKETKNRLNELGQVKYIVAGDYEHYFFIKEYSLAYPDAKVIGVDGLKKKVPDVKWTGEYGTDPFGTTYGFEDEIQAHYFATFRNKDLIFCHKESRTLIAVDLLFNLPCTEQYANTQSGKPKTWFPFYGWLAKRFQPMSNAHQDFLWKASVGHGFAPNEKPTGSHTASVKERRKKFAEDAEQVASWDFDRIIPCHGDVIENGGKESWLTLYSFFLNPEGKSKVTGNVWESILD